MCRVKYSRARSSRKPRSAEACFTISSRCSVPQLCDAMAKPSAAIEVRVPPALAQYRENHRQSGPLYPRCAEVERFVRQRTGVEMQRRVADDQRGIVLHQHFVDVQARRRASITAGSHKAQPAGFSPAPPMCANRSPPQGFESPAAVCERSAGYCAPGHRRQCPAQARNQGRADPVRRKAGARYRLYRP